MAKSARDFEQELLADIENLTGHTLDGWIQLISECGETKVTAITKWIKQNHGLNHMQANMIASIYLNEGKPVFDYEVMFQKLLAGKESQLPLYQELEAFIKANIPNVNIFPTKTYMTIDDEKCFAAAKINKKNIRVGLDLSDDVPFGNYVQKAKSLGTMPRISHMVEITESSHINDDLLAQLKLAHENVHG